MSPPGGDRFVDDDGNPFEDDIEAIAECGITRGCNPPDNDRFCPSNLITRGQMAAFFDRAFDLPATSTNHFVDDEGTIFEPAIDRLAASGITLGCNPPDNDRFCPDDRVTRDQMAAFLHRALTRVEPAAACVCRPSAERCNALDDDCDGEVDEHAAAETCNGRDDDCDGDVDEHARPEACNGRDDDCDDAVDEDPQEESCNDIDDDCDDAVDEGVSCEGIDAGVIVVSDGGTSAVDAGEPTDAATRASADAGPMDARPMDAGPGGEIVGGCGCRVGPRPSPTPWLLGLLAIYVARRASRAVRTAQGAPRQARTRRVRRPNT